MKLIVGLGNPGPKYRWTRHNLGFLVLEAFLADHGAPQWRSGSECDLVETEIEGKKYVFAKPRTFMNRSGRALVKLAKKYSVDVEETLVVHDEADFEFGKIRLKKGGGSGGHNGLRSIEEVWGEREYYRLRVGVGKGGYELADFLLEPIPRNTLIPLAESGAEALALLLSEGPKMAMNQINRKEIKEDLKEI